MWGLELGGWFGLSIREVLADIIPSINANDIILKPKSL